ncbi:bifunctional serine/threonine-protein kinase/formylglycine-generating enzyme family protein [Prosthecobacter dejongeii]|uniref:Serine/threonine protein kinase n=1 Tax=Prosthecobacter dejongeii TaxID=48465 RepID=A0A7W8DPQ6_9BACT|nr:bifunctional serine/threonine-protein kinase/formylglycine-generating enzyme family protein [Prosthecobacter dejongeii]MBB5037909.1 serine/threonine protein kinase [Prosthecobacter dejongeii]
MSRPASVPFPPPGPSGDDEASPADSQAGIQLPAPPRGPRGPRDKDGPPSHRDDILIPDYTLIKRIGSGAYGEVWLAQSVTGAYRAVKIVWREDFELTRTFHREFLGIQQFEPISRGHPCMVHILHVGWNEQRGFYYCVMELADDAEEGPNFESVATYVPRTLGTDMKRHGRLDLIFCRDAGVYLADALYYMHNRGLTHRDIKPSNIIFCGGVCKLADIGLVAGFGERTFVGTEGFVPPEGPGTAQADIYSLGKVLYEMSSGKDRMEFPEVPINLGDDEWPFWLDLNRVICKACAPDLKERFQTAGEFAEALQRVGEKRPETFFRRFSRAAVFTLVGSALTGASITAAKYQDEWAYELPLPIKAAPPLPQPPQKGRPWQNVYRQWFTFSKDRHIADLPVEVTLFLDFQNATQRPAEFGVVQFVTPDKKTLNCVMIQDADADAFCDWMTQRDRQSGRLDIDHEYSWRVANIPTQKGTTTRSDWQAIRTEIVRVPYGRISLDSTPRGAEVYEGEQSVGRTPLQLSRVRAAKFEYEVRLPGYKSEFARGNLKEGQAMSFNLRLKATGSAVFGKPWENSLDIKMVPMGRSMLATIETRRKDFAEFARSTNLPPVEGRILDADLDLPVTHVTRAEAEQFCRWLTDRERGKGLLEPDQEYRLPTDDEWSMAAYLPREVGATPADRSNRIEGIYPWGFTPSPTVKVANLQDKSADPTGKKSVLGYDDGAAGLAPVGSLRADSRGLFDLSGNVWEWVADPWDTTSAEGVARGAAFTTSERQQLLASYRRKLSPASREADVGFRILLIGSGLSARDDE